MSRVIAAYDLDEDHGRLWVNANLKRMPDIVIVANQPMDRAQTVTYVPEARLLEAIDENRRVEAENAKLRELVQKMMRFMEDGDWCTTCEVEKECDAQECDAQEQYEEDCLMRGVFHDRMRELGVEVDG